MADGPPDARRPPLQTAQIYGPPTVRTGACLSGLILGLDGLNYLRTLHTNPSLTNFDDWNMDNERPVANLLQYKFLPFLPTSSHTTGGTLKNNYNNPLPRRTMFPTTLPKRYTP
jgi:hypothetical protein